MQKFNTHTGTLKSSLESKGLKFTKSWDGQEWNAHMDGVFVAQHRELSVCVKEAAKALGEI